MLHIQNRALLNHKEWNDIVCRKLEGSEDSNAKQIEPDSQIWKSDISSHVYCRREMDLQKKLYEVSSRNFWKKKNSYSIGDGNLLPFMDNGETNERFE